MSKIEIDNKWIADYKVAVKIIKSEMAEKLKEFNLVKEDLEQETYYYYLVNEYKEISIKLGGERGAISIQLKSDGIVASLYRKEKGFNELSTASENNFIIAIGLLKEYLERNKLI